MTRRVTEARLKSPLPGGGTPGRGMAVHYIETVNPAKPSARAVGPMRLEDGCVVLPGRTPDHELYIPVGHFSWVEATNLPPECPTSETTPLDPPARQRKQAQ